MSMQPNRHPTAQLHLFERRPAAPSSGSDVSSDKAPGAAPSGGASAKRTSSARRFAAVPRVTSAWAWQHGLRVRPTSSAEWTMPAIEPLAATLATSGCVDGSDVAAQHDGRSARVGSPLRLAAPRRRVVTLDGAVVEPGRQPHRTHRQRTSERRLPERLTNDNASPASESARRRAPGTQQVAPPRARSARAGARPPAAEEAPAPGLVGVALVMACFFAAALLF